jgi:hypothetical protein
MRVEHAYVLTATLAGMREAILIAALALVGALGALTVAVIVRNGLDPLTVISLLIIGTLGTGLFGALRTPPDDDQG